VILVASSRRSAGWRSGWQSAIADLRDVLVQAGGVGYNARNFFRVDAPLTVRLVLPTGSAEVMASPRGIERVGASLTDSVAGAHGATPA
jgi:hypothetical protein